MASRQSHGPGQLDDSYPEVLERALRRAADGDLDGGRTAIDEIRFEAPGSAGRGRGPAIAVVA